MVLASVSGTAALLLVLLTVAVMVALIDARRKIAKLQELLDADRVYAARTAGKVGVSEESFHVQRLARSAEQAAQQDPQLSLQLVIAAAELALAKNVEMPAFVVERLQEASIAKAALSDTTPDESVVETDASLPEPIVSPTIQQQIDHAKSLVVKPLTDFQRTIYGIQLDDHKSENNEQSQSDDASRDTLDSNATTISAPTE